MNECLPISQTDLNLPLVYPFTGKIGLDNYKMMCSILCKCFVLHDQYDRSDLHKNISFIKSNMLHENWAVVTSKKTRHTRVDKSKRICFRKTFDTKIVKQINDVILSDIKEKAKSLLISPQQIVIDESHGDILYYDEDGFFSPHRDTVNKKENLEGWRMYSLIVGIDSNILNRSKVNDGNTVVYLPSRSYVIDKKKINLTKKMIPHSFPDSCMPRHFLVFPAESLHSSTRIAQKDGYKMALKLDLWLKISQIKTVLTKNIQMYPFTRECMCKLCNPRRLNLIDLISFGESLGYPETLWNVIAEYSVDIIERFDCICTRNHSCPCTCLKCEQCGNVYYNMYDHSDPYDDCNGYCD